MLDLPIVGTKAVRGEVITVRAVPYYLAEMLAAASGNNAQIMSISREIVEGCATMKGGAAVDCDRLTVKEVGELVGMACDPEADADFPEPSGD